MKRYITILIVFIFAIAMLYKSKMNFVDNLYANIDRAEVISYNLKDNQIEQDFYLRSLQGRIFAICSWIKTKQ